MRKYRRNFKWKKNNKLIMIFIVIFTVLVSMSVGYSLYTDQIRIEGSANAIQAVLNTYTIVYDPNGGTGTMSPQDVDVGEQTNLTTNTFQNSPYPFSHWNTQPDGSGTDYYDGQSIQDIASAGDTVTLYAQWAYNVARIGSTYYPTLQAAVDAVVVNDPETTVELLVDVSENINVAAGKTILFDFKNHTISVTSVAVITNNGTVTITNGTLTSSATNEGTINNNQTGKLNIIGGQIIMSNVQGKQAIYNDKGTVNISGTAYIQSNSGGNQKRAAVQNQASGTLNITGGTIVSPNYIGVLNSGTMNIGVKDGTANKDALVIQGGTYGIDPNNKNFNFYDGTIKGKTNAIKNESYVYDKEDGYGIVHPEEIIDGVVYKTAYLATTNSTVTFNPNGGSIASAERTRSIENGTAVGALPTPNERVGYEFLGWFTDPDPNSGTQVTPATIITADVTFYAGWHKVNIAKVDGVEYPSLQAALNVVPTDGTEKTVIVIHDTAENVKVQAGQNVLLDIGNFTVGNLGAGAVIENNGDLEIVSGTITSNGNNAAINNKGGGILKLSGTTTIHVTGQRQAIFNYPMGYVEITDNVHLSSTTTGYPDPTLGQLQRGTVHNLAGATMVITGGTIECSTQHGVTNEGDLTVGVKDGTISTTTPSITANMNGILSNGTLNFYDGIVKGKTAAIDGTVGDIETDSQFVDDSDGTYYIKYLELIPQNPSPAPSPEPEPEPEP